jgi:hypothetical protein
VVDRGVLGTAIPVDPGSHVVEAVAPGKRKWSVTIDVRPGSQLTVAIPALEADSAVARSDVPAKHDDTPSPSTPSPSGRGKTLRIVALSVGGLGVAGLVVGSIFGLQAKSQWADAKQQCANYPHGCSPDAVALGEDADRAAVIANISFAVGVVGLAGGAWFSAPSGIRPHRDAHRSVGFDVRQFSSGETSSRFESRPSTTLLTRRDRGCQTLLGIEPSSMISMLPTSPRQTDSSVDSAGVTGRQRGAAGAGGGAGDLARRHRRGSRIRYNAACRHEGSKAG